MSALLKILKVKVSLWFLLASIVGVLALFVYVSILFDASWQLKLDTSKAVQPGLDIATSISVIIAMAGFVISMLVEKRKDRVAKAKEAKLENLKTLLEQLHKASNEWRKLHKQLYEAISSIKLKSIEFQQKRDGAYKPFGIGFNETTKSDIELMVEKTGSGLFYSFESKEFSFNLEKSFRVFFDDINSIVNETLTDPFINWSLEKSSKRKIEILLRSIVYVEFNLDKEPPDILSKDSAASIYTFEFHKNLLENVELEELDIKIDYLFSILEVLDTISSLNENNYSDFNEAKQIVMSDIEVLLG